MPVIKIDDAIHHLASKEIKQVMCDTNVKTHTRLTTIQEQQQYMVRYQREFSKFINSSERILDSMHTKYATDCMEREMIAQEIRWDSVLKLYTKIFDTKCSVYRRGKIFHTMYDHFFKLEQNRFISRPNFVSFLKELWQYDVGIAFGHKRSLALDSVYTAFDVLGKGTFDWRSFLFHLNFASNPTLPCKEQLVLAFSIIASRDGLGPTSANSCVDLRDLGLIVDPFARADIAKSIISVMDEAWSQIMSSAETPTFPTKLSVSLFRKMLAQKCVHMLFHQSTLPWGRGKIFPVFICQWESDYYPHKLFVLVQESRREKSISDKLTRDEFKTKQEVWKQWSNYKCHQRSLRSMLNMINKKMTTRMFAQGFLAFLRCTQYQKAVLEIQRIGRGWQGRVKARICWILNASATLIQAHIRRCIAIKRFQEVWVYYNWAILEIQRHIRGALGRSLALKKLTALVEKEHTKNMNEKRKLEMTRGERAIIKLQSFFRKEKATSKVQELREQNRRERNIRHAMENQREAFRRERKVYERQLEQFYLSLKEENDMKEKKELKVARDQIQVRTLRRRIKNDELKNAEPDNSEQLLTDEWKKNWELKIQNGVESIKEYSIHCLESPDNRREKKTGALVRKRIRGRVSQVILRADSRGILMETPEAKEIAKDEIVFIIGEEERARLRSEMDKAFFQRKQEKEEAAHKARMKKRTETARSEVHAVNVVGKACRKWLARKELRRLCLEKFEKIYDDTEHTFYYINKETGDTFWSKPKAMGMFEIPTKYEWKLLRDAHDFPYYFNPCSMEMRWNPPPQEETCCGTVPHTWWREYPVQLGKCPNFASLLNENDGKRYCSGCYCASSVEPKF